MVDLSVMTQEQTDPYELAKAYRHRATELIWIAQGLRNSKSAAILLQTAQDYQRTADAIERVALTNPAIASRAVRVHLSRLPSAKVATA